MNKSLRDQWVAKLLSGEYAQGRGVLKEEVGGQTRHCCLGVLADVMRPSDWIPSEYLTEVSTMCGEDCFLPGTLRDEAGLTDDDCHILMKMNDNEMASFAQIAQHIKAAL